LKTTIKPFALMMSAIAASSPLPTFYDSRKANAFDHKNQ
jgi:hypothetical protein